MNSVMGILGKKLLYHEILGVIQPQVGSWVPAAWSDHEKHPCSAGGTGRNLGQVMGQLCSPALSQHLANSCCQR